MEKKIIRRFLLAVVSVMMLTLCACGQTTADNKEANTDSKTETVTEETSKEDDKKKEDSKDKEDKDNKKEEEKKTSTDTSNVNKTDIEMDFDLNVCGRYFCYANEKESKFEIGSVDGLYYIEYRSETEFGAAEIEILDGKVSKDGELYFTVNMYPFSGAAFAGDYQGQGTTCAINIINGKTIVLSEGQPFMAGQELSLEKNENSKIHGIEFDGAKNATVSELVGEWRSSYQNDEGTVNVYVSLGEDGAAKVMCKAEGYPVSLYKGAYEAKMRGGKVIGSLKCERVGYGDISYNWDLSYNEQKKIPVIREESSDFNPFTMENNNDINFEKTNSGQVKYVLGPVGRGNVLGNLYQEYTGMSISNESNTADYDPNLIEAVVARCKEFTNAPICTVDSITPKADGGIITVHCYELVDDGNGQGHTATYNWIEYDIASGTFTDFFGNTLE